MKNGMTYIQLLNETLHCYASKAKFRSVHLYKSAKGIVGNEAQIYNF